MLHVTNGDSAAQGMRAAGIEGEILPWRDVLHDGPVPAGLSLTELGNGRADFLATVFGDAIELRRELAARDAVLQNFGAHDEVVLWFEHDLYDMLQLAQILDFFASADLGATRFSMICGDEYLGPSTPARLAERFPAREPVTAAQLTLGRDAWAAFRAPDPRAIESLVAGDTSTLPYLGPALVRHLEQFPSTVNGLSRSEQQALEEIDAGAHTAGEAFVAHQRREDPIWMGDSTFFNLLGDLARGAHPLVTLGDGSDDIARTVSLTEAGRRVLAGRDDRVRLNGLDRWLGGVHLTGHEAAFRWDPEARRLIATG